MDIRADLHIHTVLSPCGDLEMSPENILYFAQVQGLNMIGITDHNSTRQAPIIRDYGKTKGIFVLTVLKMGNAREGNIWITLQTHKNIMAIASLKELAAIVLVKGYRPEEDTVSESEAEGIPILSTSRQTFEMTGEIYELLQKKEQ